MKALNKRHIQSGTQYDNLFPKSINVDTVIQSEGKAKLHHTINLMKEMTKETIKDTQWLSKMLKRNSLKDTCKAIWDFVYDHIQYTKDKFRVEQVRRPSRTWKDRQQGVDCDCYTVFISTVLKNLDIPHKMRITKYDGKSYFQHIYPIVPISGGGYITVDCVTHKFNFEVPYSGVLDFDTNDNSQVKEINESNEVSGVDDMDVSSVRFQNYILNLADLVA